MAVLRPAAPAVEAPDEKTDVDVDTTNWEYDPEYSKTTVYGDYQCLDATDPFNWVNSNSENSVEVIYFRMCIHFYAMKGITH